MDISIGSSPMIDIMYGLPSDVYQLGRFQQIDIMFGLPSDIYYF